LVISVRVSIDSSFTGTVSSSVVPRIGSGSVGAGAGGGNGGGGDGFDFGGDIVLVGRLVVMVDEESEEDEREVVI
jgi:hypothetical protein